MYSSFNLPQTITHRQGDRPQANLAADGIELDKREIGWSWDMEANVCMVSLDLCGVGQAGHVVFYQR